MEPLSGVLFSLYRGTPNHGEWVIACLEGVWEKLLGDRLAAVCRPVRYENGGLFIEITDRDWDSAIKSLRATLLEKLRAATAGEVKAITFIR